MARSYKNIQMYGKEILDLKEKGLTHREIAEKIGLEYKQVKNYVFRQYTNQRKIADGTALKAKGRPSKDCRINKEDKITELKYIIARKDAKIKQLEMETELMRDFLSYTERK